MKRATKSKVVRFGISMDSTLLKGLDRILAEKGYKSRSEALRDMIRTQLVEQEWEERKKETVGIISIVYSHEARELTEALTSLQHHYYKQIISVMHIHLDKHNCLEVLIVKGRVNKISEIADKLISIRGVKHGKLTMTTTGKRLV